MNRLCRGIAAITMVALFCGFAVPGQTDSKPMTIQALYEQWEEKGYPDDVGGVYYDQEAGGYFVLVTTGNFIRLGELKKGISSRVGFTRCAYSHDELMAVQREIGQELEAQGGESGLYAVGIGWYAKDGEVMGFGESEKEFRVVVGVDKARYSDYRTLYKERYGDKVFVEITEPMEDWGKE